MCLLAHFVQLATFNNAVMPKPITFDFNNKKSITMGAHHNQTLQLPSPGFIKASIKIAHPDWTAEQVDAEFQIKMIEIQKQMEDGSCEFCSS